MDMEGAVVEQGKQQQHLPRALLALGSGSFVLQMVFL